MVLTKLNMLHSFCKWTIYIQYQISIGGESCGIFMTRAVIFQIGEAGSKAGPAKAYANIYTNQLNPCKNRLYRPCQAALTDRSTFTREKVRIKRNSIRTNVSRGFDQREMISSLGWTLCEKSSHISWMKLRYESWKTLLFSWLLFCRN